MSQISCQEALARLYELLDGELPADHADRIREHLERCGSCFPSLCAARAFQELLRRVSRGQPNAPPHLRERLLDLLRSEGLDPGP